ncbi:hypothetical protein ACQ5SO_16420 [Rhodovulum sp. DZ06]|uniref:hypothetical protein n=1 Tax=Rhodovulum sp. DZ06 TaxID=3425126 RepID=UPI003D34F377
MERDATALLLEDAVETPAGSVRPWLFTKTDADGTKSFHASSVRAVDLTLAEGAGRQLSGAIAFALGVLADATEAEDAE